MTIQEQHQQELINVCINIKELCQKHNLSLTQLSEQSGIPLYAVHEIEIEILTNAFTLDILFIICKFFQIPVYKIFSKNQA